jgi:peptidoglycan/xylan/chitin deacetylase (PgdA/CDA1 family)
MYHVIGEPPPGVAYPGLYVAPGDFSAQMRWLAAQGYHAVMLDRVYEHWTGDRALPPRPIVLSFDDGHVSHHSHALPILRDLGWPGVLNLAPGRLDGDGELSSSMVHDLIEAGWEIDSHTMTHRDLTIIRPARLLAELLDSRMLIHERFEAPANFICYPAGRFNERVIAAARGIGYRGGTTTRFGLARPTALFTLARVRVDRSDGPAGLEHKLAGLWRKEGEQASGRSAMGRGGLEPPTHGL